MRANTNMNPVQAKKGVFQKALDVVEKVGNKLPHPLTLFFFFSLAIILISEIAARAGLQVTHPGTGKVVAAVSLMTAQGVRDIITKAVTNFTGFAPLGTVLVAMLGVGVAESTGLISAALRKLVLSAPARLITIIVVFAGVMSNIASDAGYVVLVPLGALVFMAFKRHPLAGMAAAFAGVSGGFSANLILGTVDPLLAGITQTSARLVIPTYSVNAAANWYFMAASTIVITIIGSIVTEKIVEPRLGTYKGKTEALEGLSSNEKRGLRAAGIAVLLFSLVVLYTILPIGYMNLPGAGMLRHQERGTVIPSPFIDGLVPILMLGFLIPAVAYGKVAGTIKSEKDIAGAMGKAMASMGGYIALAFMAAQFVSYFNWTNLGLIMAVKGADFLKASGFAGLPLIIGFIGVSAFINLFIGSASAKWNIMAPVFVPMLILLGYTPELTQVAYRIGDSVTNIISPLMSYFAVIVAFGKKYDEDLGIGTLISNMVPYSVAFLVGWTILFVVWYVLGLPLGPGATIFMP